MTRTKPIIVICDGYRCSEFAQVEAELAPVPGWFQLRVVQADGSMDPKTYEFHSLKCVQSWSRNWEKITRAMEDQKIVSEDNT